MDTVEPGSEPTAANDADAGSGLHPLLLRLIEALARADVERDYAEALALARASRAELARTEAANR